MTDNAARMTESQATQFDVVVIGAGIVGCSIAWRLTGTNLKVALLEKGSDIANGATRANSGILHSGIHEEPDSEAFLMCRKGLAWYREWSARLDYPLQNKPTVILAHDTASLHKLEKLAEAHSETLQPQLLDQHETLSRWPFLGERICCSVVVNDSAQILPYDTCRAILENAISNGLIFMPDHTVSSVENTGDSWHLHTETGKITTRYVVLAAGAGSNELSLMFGLAESHQTLINGAYYMLARSAEPQFEEIFFTPPSETTKGLVLQQTIHGNLMLGPDAIPSEDLSDGKLAWDRYCKLWSDCQNIIPQLNRKEVIRTFTGERVNVGKGFQFDDYLTGKRLLRIDGIKSPGLTAAPAIAMKVEELLNRHLEMNVRNQLNDARACINTEIETHPPGELVCRCEKVFMSQIEEAIRRGANNIESLRWQTRAGMGDCQGSFCRPQLTTILKKCLDLPAAGIILKNKGSYLFTDDLK